jgi:hypothetical protein
MILDSGICTVFRKTDTSAAGSMPTIGYTLIESSWYKELSYETSPEWPTEGRKEQKADGRIRILQNRGILQDDVVVLEHLTKFNDKSANALVYRIIRAYHGKDDDGPTLISDLTLEVTKP